MTTPSDGETVEAVTPSDAETQPDNPTVADGSVATDAEPGETPPADANTTKSEAEGTGTGAGDEAKPATYEGLALSEGSLLEDADLGVVREFAKANAFSDEQAAAFLAYEEQRAKRVSDDFDAMTAQWKEQWQGDPKLGGSQENRDRTQGFVRAALAELAPEGAADFLAGTGYEDHPVVVALLAEAGRRLSEPEMIVRGGRTDGQGGPDYRKRYPNSHQAMEAAAARHAAAGA
jgi:hypothetical protein